MSTQQSTKKEDIGEKNNINSESIKEKKITEKDTQHLIEAIESAGLEEFMEYIRSPWKMLWPNFIAGVARGIGTLIGAALVLALIGWVFSRMISLPLIGEKLAPYVESIQTEINKYTESTNYKQNFTEMEKLLREIRDELKKKK